MKEEDITIRLDIADNDWEISINKAGKEKLLATLREVIKELEMIIRGSKERQKYLKTINNDNKMDSKLFNEPEENKEEETEEEVEETEEEEDKEEETEEGEEEEKEEEKEGEEL